MTDIRPRHILPTIVFAQFAGTSVWFASNAVIGDLEGALGLSDVTAWLTGAVQLGFITGTTALSTTGLADRFPARWVFLAGCLLAGAFNLGALAATGVGTLMAARFATGVALAAIYPIGMKVAAGWYRGGLGSALGWLVGALVLGTAFPHLLRGLSTGLPWASVIVGTSVLAVVGGLALGLLVPEGPHTRAGARGLDPGALPRLWRISAFRGSALGYFGHMWELYTLWAVLPAVIASTTGHHPSLPTFAAIATGALGCVVGGELSNRIGSKRVAQGMLAISGVCCLVAPVVFGLGQPALIYALLALWGFSVVGDSAQFSALSAKAAPAELIGTGLAFVTAVGFALTVVSLQVASLVPTTWVAWALLPGPLLGLWGLRAAAD